MTTQELCAKYLFLNPATNMEADKSLSPGWQRFAKLPTLGDTFTESETSPSTHRCKEHSFFIVCTFSKLQFNSYDLSQSDFLKNHFEFMLGKTLKQCLTQPKKVFTLFTDYTWKLSNRSGHS